MRRILIAILTILLLSSCGTVNTNVTVFHELTPEPKTFAFIQLKEQEGSLEHKRYEELVRSKLVQRGYKEVQLSEADYVIGMIYGIGSQLVTSSYPFLDRLGFHHPQPTARYMVTLEHSLLPQITILLMVLLVQVHRHQKNTQGDSI